MKRLGAGVLVSLISLSVFAQTGKENNTLLWKISGNGLEKPSYLFGTIHLLCKEDALLSDNMKKAISDCDEVYFEVDMDNIFEMFGAMDKMKMRNDTTLQELLSEEDYQKVKDYFETKSTMLPFSMLETYKPMLAASTIEEGSMPCDNTTMMEQVIMALAKDQKKKIKGLETMAYQASVLDSIPYKLQAEQLVAFINKSNNGEENDSEMNEMFEAYKKQDLQKLESLLISTDAGIAGFTDVLLYNRNKNWVEKLGSLLSKKSLMIAVGAGHLPGKKGVINLLREKGYTLTPVENKISALREI